MLVIEVHNDEEIFENLAIRSSMYLSVIVDLTIHETVTFCILMYK